MQSRISSDSDSSDEWDADLYGPPTLPGGLSAYHVIDVSERRTQIRDVIAREIAELKRITEINRKAQENRKVFMKQRESQTKISGAIVASQTFTGDISNKVILPCSSITKKYSYIRDKYYLVEKDWPTSLHSKSKRDKACQTILTGDVFPIKKVYSNLENEKEQPTELSLEMDDSSHQLYVIVP